MDTNDQNSLRQHIAVAILQGSEFFETLFRTYNRFHHVPSLKMADQVTQFVSDAAHWTTKARVAEGDMSKDEAAMLEDIVAEIDKIRDQVAEALHVEALNSDHITTQRAEAEKLANAEE